MPCLIFASSDEEKENERMVNEKKLKRLKEIKRDKEVKKPKVIIVPRSMRISFLLNFPKHFLTIPKFENLVDIYTSGRAIPSTQKIFFVAL